MDSKLAELIYYGVEKRVFSGGVGAVSRVIGFRRKRSVAAAGIKDIRFPDDQVQVETVYDLASLSKPLATSLILYSLIGERFLKFDDTLDTLLINNIPADKGKITIRQLLSHSAGLIGYRPYYQNFQAVRANNNKSKLLKYILDEPLQYEPGSACVYSDPGFIILGLVAEEVSGQGLDSLFQRYISGPLDLEDDIFYLPSGGKEVEKKSFAATEDCPWRGRILQAEVHDEHCWLMGGVAGHAGLFGRIEGVLRLCEAVLDQWKGRKQSFHWSEILQQGLQKQYPDRSWCLGFDSPSLHGSSGGRYLSSKSVGHLGFTGTSFWIDLERELVMVLLSNRVHPDRENTGIRAFRPIYHDRIGETLAAGL